MSARVNMQQRGGGWPTGGAGTGAAGQGNWTVGANPQDRAIPLGQVWNSEHKEQTWAVQLASLLQLGPAAAARDQAMWQARLEWGNDFASQTALVDWPVGGAVIALTAGFVRLSAVSRYADANAGGFSTLGTAVQGAGWISDAPASLRGDPPTWTTPSVNAVYGSSPRFFETSWDIPARARWYRPVGYTQILAPNGNTVAASLPLPLPWIAKAGFAGSVQQWTLPGGVGAVLAVDWAVSPDVDTVAGTALPVVAFATQDDKPWWPLHPRAAAVRFQSQLAQPTAAGSNPIVSIAMQFLLDLG